MAGMSSTEEGVGVTHVVGIDYGVVRVPGRRRRGTAALRFAAPPYRPGWLSDNVRRTSLA
jgi:hypothetical protein